MIPTIGIIHEGDLVAARVKGAEALECAKALGATLTVAWTTITLSGIESRAGNAELALRYTTDALATFRAFNDTRGVACALNNTAEYLISLARYSEAETRACEALDVAREHRWDGQIANALQKFAAIAALRPQRTAEPGPSGIRAGARILGFVDARLTAIMGAGPRDLDQQPEYDRIIGALRSALSAEALARLMAEGAALTEEQAVAEALV
jgi:tetratricopeptide (TPR) repeat protein